MISTLKIMNEIIELKEINKKYYDKKRELTAIEDISFKEIIKALKNEDGRKIITQ